MLYYVFRRILLLIPTILCVMLILFAILYFTPGDPARVALGEEASFEAIQAFRMERGLDDPFFMQFARYVYGVVVEGDLGYSYAMRTPVSMEIVPRIPVTLQLSLGAIIMSTLVGIPLGVICAVRQYSLIDSVTTLITLVGVSIPTFWTGLLLILAFSVNLGWLPSMGFDTLSEAVLPIVTLCGTSMAMIARMTRSSMLEVIKSDYVRTARAKGQKERTVIFRHALPNALAPILTIIGMQFGTLLGGAIVTEAVFSISGIGRLMLEAIKMRDYPVIQACVLFIAVAFCLINLLVDILYAWADPRIRIK